MPSEKRYRTLVIYDEHFEKFFIQQRQKVKDKIIWTLDLLQELKIIPESYLKHLQNTDGLYEIRVKQGSDIFRIFCFFDNEKIVVLMNGFQKKTQKTPKNEIEKALKIKKNYEGER